MRDTVAVEAPRVMLLTVGIIVAFDLGYALVGIIATPGYYLSDALQALVLAIGAIGLQHGRIPNRHAPWVVLVGVVANNVATTYQATIVGAGALGVVALLLAVAGAVILEWLPFLLATLFCTTYTGLVLRVTLPDQWVTWYITMLTAAAVSAMVLYGRRESMTRFAEAQYLVEHMATADQLTGVLNRHGLAEHLPALLGRAQRQHSGVFVVFFDVTGLRQVNNGHGHAAGDRVLDAVATALRTHCRAEELIVRWGGDEFLVVGVGPRPDAATIRARILGAIDSAPLADVWDPGLWAGTAEGPAEATEVGAIVTRADLDMIARRDHSTAVPSAQSNR